MANSAHSALTGSDLHEPIGVAAASADTVYVADGAGSGTHQKVAAGQISTTSVKNVNKVFITHVIDDISTAGSHWVVPGIAGNIVAISTVIDGAIATAACSMTFEIGGVVITSSAISIAYSGSAAGSAAGDVDTSTPSAARAVTAAQPVEIISDGASTNTVRCTVTLELDVA
jgi:hypothetical protein